MRLHGAGRSAWPASMEQHFQCVLHGRGRMNSPEFMKNISSAFAIVFSRCAMITFVVDFGSLLRILLKMFFYRTVSILAVAS